MVKRIDSLSEAQKARMPEWRDKWIEIGLRTGDSDKAAFAEHVRGCYEAAKLAPPERIIYVPSPLRLALEAPAAAMAIELKQRIPEGAVLSDADRAAITTATKEVIRRAWGNIMGGQFWVGGWWGSPAYVAFFTDVCGLELAPETAAAARAYRGTSEAACWWCPHRDFVMVSERPKWIDRDDLGRLHSTSRHAIEWPDGWGLYRVHGVDVPADIVLDPGAISVKRIDEEPNAEVRRIMLEIYGLQKYVASAKAEILDQDVDLDGQPRRLLRHSGMVFCEVRNSTLEADGTRKTYLLAVHPELRPIPPSGSNLPLGGPQKMTCRNAIASMHYLRGEEYRPEIET